jgi:hypothetical protein
MTDGPIVDVIIRHRALAITEDGERLPITNWFDSDGEECPPVAAMSCVAEYGDKYITIDLRHFHMFGGN